MRVRLVIDVLHGEVVRGVAGNRDTYRPVESVLTESTRTADVAAAFRERLGATAIYVADLDGIRDSRPNLEAIADLASAGFDVLADTGVRSAEDAHRLAGTGASGVVCALETLPSPAALEAIADRVPADRLVFSLDLRDGEPIRSPAWPAEPLAIVDRVASLVRGVIVLDLAAVGTGGGVPTLDLCRTIRDRHPGLTLVTGGGIRSATDLRVLNGGPFDELLIASAVHDGSVSRNELLPFVDTGSS